MLSILSKGYRQRRFTETEKRGCPSEGSRVHTSNDPFILEPQSETGAGHRLISSRRTPSLSVCVHMCVQDRGGGLGPISFSFETGPHYAALIGLGQAESLLLLLAKCWD